MYSTNHAELLAGGGGVESSHSFDRARLLLLYERQTRTRCQMQHSTSDTAAKGTPIHSDSPQLHPQMEDSQENLVFASAMQYSEESGLFFKSPTDVQQQLLQYKPPVVRLQDDQNSYGDVIIPANEKAASSQMISDPLAVSSTAKSSTTVPLLERIQQQKKQQPDTVLGTVRSGGIPPAHAFGTKSNAHMPDVSKSAGERNSILDEYMNSQNPSIAATAAMKTSFLQHDSPVFDTPDHHSFGPSSIPIPTYRPTNHHPNTQPADFKSQMYNIMTQAGSIATHTGYHVYHHVSDFFQGHSSSDNNNNPSLRKMDYQRQSLLRDPHEDKELYDDPEQNISDSLVLDESTMNQRVDVHRKRQLQWQRQQQQLGRDGVEEGQGGRTWIQYILQCGNELKELYMTAPFHIQVGTVGVGILIVWLLFS